MKKSQFKQTGLLLGFLLIICMGSIATSGLAWFITREQGSVSVSKISVLDRRGRLSVSLSSEIQTASEEVPYVDGQLDYTLTDSISAPAGGRRISAVYANGLDQYIPVMGSLPDSEYYYLPIDGDDDGNEETLRLNKALPASAVSLTVSYCYDSNGSIAGIKAMNVNQIDAGNLPSQEKDGLTIHPEKISDISSDGASFYRNVIGPDGHTKTGVRNLTGVEKIYGGASIGSYIQFSFIVANEADSTAPEVDIAISKVDDSTPLLSVEGATEAQNHFRMAIYDTSDPENAEKVFFYEEKEWDADDRYVSSLSLDGGNNITTPIEENDIVSGDEFVRAGSMAESGEIALPGNQLLYSGLAGGESVRFTIRLWCEGTLCEDEDIEQACNANFNLVGFDHV